MWFGDDDDDGGRAGAGGGDHGSGLPTPTSARVVPSTVRGRWCVDGGSSVECHAYHIYPKCMVMDDAMDDGRCDGR